MADSPPPSSSPSSEATTRPSFPPMPRLASTVTSREHAFDADPDELPDEVARQEKVDELMSIHGLLQQGANRGSVQLSPSDRAKYMGHGLEETLEAGDFEEDDDEDEDEDRAEGGSRGLLNGHSNAARGRGGKEGELPARVLDDGASLWSAVSNMANAILGAGIIGLPYALRQAGFFLGIGLVVVLGYVTDWTIRLIAVNSKLTGQPTYIGMMEASYGLPGKAAVSFFQFTFAFGGSQLPLPSLASDPLTRRDSVRIRDHRR